MPFAFAVIKRNSDISECPLLSSNEIENIRASIVKSDWRESLISKFKEYIGRVSFSKIAEGIRALKNNSLMLNSSGPV